MAYCSLTNKQVAQLLSLIRASKSGFRSLHSQGKEQFRELMVEVEDFLRTVAAHHTDDVAVWHHAVAGAREELLELGGWDTAWASLGRFFKLARPAVRFRKHTARSWIFCRVREAVRKAQTLAKRGRLPALAPHKNISLRTPPILIAIKNKNCFPVSDLKRPWKLRRAGHCFRACDIGFMTEFLSFKRYEIAFAFFTPRTTLAEVLEKCESSEKAASLAAC